MDELRLQNDMISDTKEIICEVCYVNCIVSKSRKNNYCANHRQLWYEKKKYVSRIDSAIKNNTCDKLHITCIKLAKLGYTVEIKKI